MLRLQCGGLRWRGSIIWLKLKGSVFGLKDDLFLCLCYNISVGSSREAFLENNIFDTLADDITYFESKQTCNFLIAGDLNARVGSRPDFVKNKYLFNLNMMSGDYEEDIVLRRVSQDKISNEKWYIFVRFCKLTGMRIMNGRVGEDAVVGKYTCVKENGRSVVDYALCRPDMMPYFNTFSVGDPNICTDHCAISFHWAI